MTKVIQNNAFARAKFACAFMSWSLGFAARFNGRDNFRYWGAVFAALSVKDTYQRAVRIFTATYTSRNFFNGAAVTEKFIDLLIEFSA